MVLEIQTRLNGPTHRDHVLVNVKKQAISLSINTDTVYTFDLSGRLLSAFRDGHKFVRGLDNRVMEKWSAPGNGRRQRIRRWLNWKKRQELYDQIHVQVWKLLCAVQAGEFDIVPNNGLNLETSKDRALSALDRILYFDSAHLEDDARKFSSIYRPIGILPPDAYKSLILQATEGCSYNRCDYCQFYKGQDFRIKPTSEFRAHVRQVREYFGPALSLRKSVFLGEAHALDIPQSMLIGFLEIVSEMLPEFAGVYGFMSAFGKQKSARDFAELGSLNLRRVYIGMETGCNELLRFLNKPGDRDKTRRLIDSIKKGGVNVGIILLLGAGGQRFSDAHVSETVQAIRTMDLDQNDIVYFSPITTFAGTEYERKMHAAKSRALRQEELEEQRFALTSGFGFGGRRPSPRLAVYNIDEFIY